MRAILRSCDPATWNESPQVWTSYPPERLLVKVSLPLHALREMELTPAS